MIYLTQRLDHAHQTTASVTLPRRATASKLRKLAMGGKSDMKALPYLCWIYSGNLTICQ